MAYNHEWPYADVQRFNKDWIIQTVKDLIKAMEDFTAYNEITFADPIEWSSGTYYKRYTIVLYTDGNSYLAKKDVPIGIPPVETKYWAKIGDFNAQIEALDQRLDALVDEWNGVTKVFPVVADMAAYEGFEVGDVVATCGYYTAGDGGAALYVIEDITPATYYENITDGKYARMLIADDTVSVLQFGAYGDNSHDDLAAFTNAINSALNIEVPFGSTYLLSDSITLGNRQNLYVPNKVCAAASPKLVFSSGGLVINGRDVCVDGVSIQSESGYNAIEIGVSGGASLPFITISNCYIFGGAYGIYTNVNAWMFNVKNVRITGCTNDMYLYDCGPCVTLDGVYFDNCSGYLLNCELTRFSARGCNFGFANGNSVRLVTTQCDFVDCNFECDETVSNTLLAIYGRQIKFTDCKFGMNGDTDCFVLNSSSATWSIIFENTIIQFQGASAGEGYKPKLIDVDHFSMYKYGSFVIGKGCANIQRPTGLYDAQRPYILDLDNNGVVHFYSTSIDKTKLTSGALLYSDSLNKLCYFNGTNVVTVDGTTVV